MIQPFASIETDFNFDFSFLVAFRRLVQLIIIRPMHPHQIQMSIYRVICNN